MCLLILIAGFGLRFYRFGELPPGLYQDEAYNGIDALRVIAGERPLYFPANNGREPFYIYLASLSIAALGPTPAAERLPAIVIGVLLLPAAYALGRALFNRRVGLIAMAIAAGSFWALALSRIGLRAGSLPLLAALSLACAAAGWKSRTMWRVALGGALYGLTFYSYLAARFTPVPLIAFLIFWYIARRQTFPALRWLAAFALPALLIAAPLAGYLISQPQTSFGRVEQVSILSPELNGGSVWGALFHNLLAALGMFFWRGDGNWRHNLAGLPVFNVALGAAGVAGAIIFFRRALGPKRDRAAALALLWSGALIAPTVLAVDAPHYLRAAGLLPVLFLFPAVALDRVWETGRREWRLLARWAAALILAASFALTALIYFGPYAHSPEPGFFFQSAAADLARPINNTTGLGWNGGLSVRPPSSTEREPRTAYLDRRLWDSFPSLRYLVPASERLVVLDEQHPPVIASGAPAALYVSPYDDPHGWFSNIPAGLIIQPGAGPLARNDQDSTPVSLYSVYEIRPYAGSGGVPVAQFDGGFTLLSAQRRDSGQVVEVTLLWQAARAPGRDYQVFAHALLDGGLIAQADGPLGLGLYPSRWWRGGEIVEETRYCLLPPAVDTAAVVIRVGLYDLQTGDRLPRTDAPGDGVSIEP